MLVGGSAIKTLFILLIVISLFGCDSYHIVDYDLDGKPVRFKISRKTGKIVAYYNEDKGWVKADPSYVPDMPDKMKRELRKDIQEYSEKSK